MRAHTRALFLAACVALFASGAHARALLDADAVPGPAAVVCTSCKDLVAQGEAFVNDPANLEKVEVEVKKICADKGDEAPMVRARRGSEPTRGARTRPSLRALRVLAALPPPPSLRKTRAGPTPHVSDSFPAVNLPRACTI